MCITFTNQGLVFLLDIPAFSTNTHVRIRGTQLQLLGMGGRQFFELEFVIEPSRCCTNQLQQLIVKFEMQSFSASLPDSNHYV